MLTLWTRGAITWFMADNQTLLNAIVESPDDDAVRLVYSDWLEEHGEADRAEFVRAQIELARGIADDARRERLRQRERELLAAHELEWVGPLRAAVRRATFVRGFVERVTVHPDRLKRAAPLLESVPVRHLIVASRNEARDVGAVATLPQLGRITTLDLRDGCTLSVKSVRQIANSPHLAGVTDLILRQRTIEEGVAEVLGGTPALARLRTLDLYDASSGIQNLPFLAGSPHLARLTTLILGGTGFGDVGAATLAHAECQLVSLRWLHLVSCNVDDDGARVLARAPHLAGLERLDLAGNLIGRSAKLALRGRFGQRVHF
jgi:uncharacterized protein (TIGR02996 family)